MAHDLFANEPSPPGAVLFISYFQYPTVWESITRFSCAVLPFFFSFKFLSSILCALYVSLNKKKKKKTPIKPRESAGQFSVEQSVLPTIETSCSRGIVNPSLFRRCVKRREEGKISYANTAEIGKNSRRDN